MSIQLVMSLLGGLALFLYGMQMMSINLEAVAGNRMKDILEKLTSNRILGVLVGAGITAVIQSSSATTVMVVGFVNSSLMTLRQAVWIIMGANIGTTVTGQLIALDIGAIAPLIAFLGVGAIVFVKNKKIQYVGGIVAGLGVLFIGMGMMSDAMMPLRDSEGFIKMMTEFSNPALGILAGALFTAVIQSSSASVGILQALAMSGLIGLPSAVFVLFGQNIGTCITAVLASIGTNRNAKRTTIIHLLFNLIGTAIFVGICLLTPFTAWMEGMTSNPAAQIANVHTVFNIATTLLLLPFGQYLAAAAEKILPDKEEDPGDTDKWFDELTVSQHVLGLSTIAVNSLLEEVQQMTALAVANVSDSFQALLNLGAGGISSIQEREDRIDIYHIKITKKISKILTIEQSTEEVNRVRRIFTIVGNLERIGDHAMNLAEYAETLCGKKLTLSPEAVAEVTKMKALCEKALGELLARGEKDDREILGAAIVFEQQIDDTNREYRNNQINRMQSGSCNVETSILYTEILTDYERIGDHILNIAQAAAGSGEEG